MSRILVVDDEVEVRQLVCEGLRKAGHETSEAGDGAAALALLPAFSPDAVLLDLRMPRKSGIPTLREMRALAPEVPVVILSGHGDIATAVEAVKGGAFDYIEKPADMARIVLTLHQALTQRRLEGEVRRISATLDTSLESRLGASPAMRGVIERVKRVAPTDLAVVIQGETGSGKTFVAQMIHELSHRAGKIMARVDISVIPPTLAESELFGARKGAYTGAERDRLGYLARAEGGSLFLDDVQSVPVELQAKLLDALETKRVCPVGADTPVTLDFRVIAASNRDLRACVSAGTFREDLLYRLGEFVIDIPPLRERTEDIFSFADRFLLEASAEMGHQVRGFSEAAKVLLLRHPWPGNIRELRSVVRRAVLLASGEQVEAGDLSFIPSGSATSSCEALPQKLPDAVKAVERRLVAEALEKWGGNKSRAAEYLGISFPTLLRKVREFGLGE